MARARIEEHELGLTWVVDESMQRGCHALVDQGRVWLVDPVADEEALKKAGELGTVTAVLQLLDRHNRDCEAVAKRFDVPLLKVPDTVPDSPFEAIAAVRVPLWKETALWWPERSALVVAEAVGTNPLFTAGRARLGMHPMLRPLPPGSLRGRQPEHLFVGHGRPLHDDATSALAEAYARARRDIPQVLRMLPGALRG